ncbi:hypothetical protein J8I29_18440 [Labrys sp. LIt4]|uniref:Uncharacterized protein n=1 Tax=Labrys okinawensis TaxID=346911 RepID=A0A2S9QJ96_9HYPH|nr:MULTISPECIES: hypothetical protein [Labrys]MBP0581314.1 hypothetical protein [Labrys sp. LIt4]PRH89362.1 hypothetical protein C5L14_01870 [Labrys okinawensis]
MKIESNGISPTSQPDPSKESQEAALQKQMEETLANFAVSMAQQQGDRALEGMQQARNEEG